MQGKNREISGPCNFWTFVKSNIPDVWTWEFWTLFGSEIKVGEPCTPTPHPPPTPPPVATPLHSVHYKCFFFLSAFSLTNTDDAQDSRGREGTIFIPIYCLQSLTKIQTFICSFAFEMNITFFNRTACIYQAATRLDLPPYWITIWMIDDGILISVCLLDDLILGFLLHQSDIGNR